MKTQDASRLIDGPDNRIMYSKGERVYVYGVTEPGRYLVYRAVKDLTDPDTRKYLAAWSWFSSYRITHIAALSLSPNVCQQVVRCSSFS